MDLVLIPMYLGCVQGCGMHHKHQNQNKGIMDWRSMIIKQLQIIGLVSKLKYLVLKATQPM